ncbi:MAG TPA: 2-succinyl-6-hydroxy-2,4-cyclohexadiene-1-carboxylate synthase [Acidimicrobiales bacterium]|nr:2-succinyl-6-hydroxy-2,4-cyclohexadiene-1-carboxylate synthase [Acidimicrobiales bacterium]
MSLLGLERAGSGPALVWLHGFTQTKRSSHRFRSILAGSYEVLTIDLPGHGENAERSASLEDTADLLAEVLPAEPFILAGYSLGGRVALHFALRHPQRLNHLVVLSATPGIASDEERRARRERDEKLADRLEAIGIDTFLDEWLAQPMFSSVPHDAAERAARSRDAHGLANSLRQAGTGTQGDLTEPLRQLSTPTSILAGAKDEKFTYEAMRLSEAIAGSTRHLVADAGHAAHLEQPQRVADLVAMI